MGGHVNGGTVLYALLGAAALAALGGAVVLVARRGLRRRIAPRVLVTDLADPTVRALFKERLSRGGWLVLDGGRPMLAQSSVLRGGRERIYLQTRAGDHGRLHVEVGPVRWEERWGLPLRTHSICRRLDAFLDALLEKDPSIQVTRAALRRATTPPEQVGARLSGRT